MVCTFSIFCFLIVLCYLIVGAALYNQAMELRGNIFLTRKVIKMVQHSYLDALKVSKIQVYAFGKALMIKNSNLIAFKILKICKIISKFLYPKKSNLCALKSLKFKSTQLKQE